MWRGLCAPILLALRCTLGAQRPPPTLAELKRRKDFAGVGPDSAVDSAMSKQVLSALAGFLGLCISLSAQEMRNFGSIQSAKKGSDFFGTLTSAWNDPVPLQLADERAFSFPSAFAWMEAPPAYYIPALALAAPPRVVPTTRSAPDSSDSTVNLLPQFDYAAGEVGFFYGESSGKFGREVTAGYIFGEVVDGNTHISVGASYEHTNGRVPVVLGR